MDVEQRLTAVLRGWAVGSVLVGGALSLRPGTRAFGRQSAAWGAVDGAIAVVGGRRRASRGPTDPARLRRVLLVNAGLDVGYLAAGAWLVRRTRWTGDGAAVLVQGAFLLVLDSAAAWALRPARGGLTDGEAVSRSRALLVAQGEPETVPWRSTVVADGPARVVRTWLRTPADAARPVGAPDVVHRVQEGPDGLVVVQVHPPAAGS